MILFFLFYASCQKQDSWSLTIIRTGDPSTIGKKLTYQVEDWINQPELEFVKIKGDLFCYLNLFHQPFLVAKKENYQSKVLVSNGEQEREFIVHCLEGGQKLKLPENAISWIIDNLLSHFTLQIILEGGYKVSIDSKQFTSYYKKLSKEEAVSLPNRLLDIAL